MPSITANPGLLPGSRQSGNTAINADTLGAFLVSEAAPPYYAMAKAGMIFTAGGTAANPSAFVGGAAGTPLLGIYNPVGSGKDIVLLQMRLAIRTTGTGAVATDFNFWGVAQGGVAVTGTQTVARSMYSMTTSGSVAYVMSNTANTAALASSLIAPSISIGLTAGTAITNVQALIEDEKGAIVVAPGNYLAWGASVATTAASFDFAAIWAEIGA